MFAGNEAPKVIITDNLIAVEQRARRKIYIMHQAGDQSPNLWTGFPSIGFSKILMGLESQDIRSALRFYKALENAEFKQANQGREDLIYEARSIAASSARRLLEAEKKAGHTDGVREERAFRRLGIPLVEISPQ